MSQLTDDRQPAGLIDRYPVAFSAATWIIRICVGALFIFSGITKGIDIWGTIFKFNEYFGALGYRVWDAMNLAGSWLLSMVEFITGFALLTGSFRRAAPIVAAAIMAVMLPLSLWLAVANPISDCGCFGDALKLSNWATFWKNVALCLGICWLIPFNRRIGWLITPYLQWIGAVAAGAYFFIIAFLGYYYQPLIDFRPYKIGTPLVVKDSEGYDSDEDDNLIFVYEKDGKTQEFTADDILPDEEDGWTFVERRYAEPDETPETGMELPAPAPAPEKNIRFFTEDGHEDVTEEVIGEGRQIVLMLPVLSEVPAARTWKINSLYQWAQANDIDMLATVGGNPKEIREWRDISLAEYPIYTSDDTSIEEVVRGNPAVVYLENDTIKWKQALRAIDIDDFQSPDTYSDPMAFAHDNMRIFRNLTWIFLAVIGVLIIMSFSALSIPKIFKLRR